MNEIGMLGNCDFVFNGQEAVLKFSELTQTDVAVTHVLTDFMMPRLNGIQTVQKIKEFVMDRNDKSAKQIKMPKFVFMTAYKNSHFDKHAQGLGVKTIFEKPMSQE